MDDDFDEKFLLEAANQADQYLDATKPKLKHTICLQTKFGHNEFRPRQWDIIRSIIEDKRDNCVIMPTGYGKSLLFQYPAVFTNGITLVVSPLISLMQDQVRSLSVANISACFLGSAQTQRDMDARVLAGEFRLVYASPEYLINATNWLKLLESQLTLIAIDEAHVSIIGMLIFVRALFHRGPFSTKRCRRAFLAIYSVLFWYHWILLILLFRLLGHILTNFFSISVCQPMGP